MSEATFKEQKLAATPEHPDYQENLKWGHKFTENFNNDDERRKILYQGGDFIIKMIQCLDNEKYYFRFDFSADKSIGNHEIFSTLIYPNDSRERFMNSFKNAYGQYSKMQREWIRKQEAQENFSDFGRF